MKESVWWKDQRGAALASSGDPESGGESPPPAKRRKSGNVRSPPQQVMHNNSKMQTSNGQADGHQANGVATNGSVVCDKFKSSTDRDIIRIIGQQLREYGLE